MNILFSNILKVFYWDSESFANVLLHNYTTQTFKI